jgi:hypothetical protein
MVRAVTLRKPTIADLGERLAELEPWLLKTDWAAMTYMLIPSVLASADALAAEMADYTGDNREVVAGLRERLFRLREV